MVDIVLPVILGSWEDVLLRKGFEVEVTFDDMLDVGEFAGYVMYFEEVLISNDVEIYWCWRC